MKEEKHMIVTINQQIRLMIVIKLNIKNLMKNQKLLYKMSNKSKNNIKMKYYSKI